MSVWPESVWSSGSESCSPRTIASRPSDSGLPYFSSIRSASWTISAISRSTGSSRSYSLRNVSKEQSSPRWESLAPPRRRAPPPPGLPRDRRRRRRLPAGPRSAGPARCRRCGPRGSPGAWPTTSDLALGAEGPGRPFAVPYGFASGLECPRCLEAQRGAEVVPAPLRPELALQLTELLRQGPAAHLHLASQALRLGDDGPVGLLPRAAEGFHQLGFLGHSPWPGLPQGRLAPGLPHPQLQPLQLLAGDGVLRERRHAVLEVEGAEVPQLAPHGHAVARGLPREAVDEEHPARPLHGLSLPWCSIRTGAGYARVRWRLFQASSPPSKQYAS